MSDHNAAMVERIAKAMRFDGSDTSPAERDEIWAKLPHGVKEYWRGFVRLTLREIAAIGDRSPSGPGRATGPVYESPGAGTAIAQTPSVETS